MKGMRIDRYMVKHGLVSSREKAKIALERALVYVNKKKVTKASFLIHEGDKVELVGQPLAYVSRGGEKLEKAIHTFNLDFNDKTVLDIGASTGGFTDCALQHGAAYVVAIDVGSDQLHTTLRQDNRVIVMEQTDIRSVTKKDLPYPVFDWVVVDVSFISISQVLDAVKRFLKKEGQAVLLVKPQFEQEQRIRTKKGVIQEINTRTKALDKIKRLLTENAMNIIGETETNADGKNKNIEFLLVVGHSDTPFTP